MNGVVFLRNPKVLLFYIAHIMYSYYKLSVVALIIYRFIACDTEYSRRFLFAYIFFEELQHNQTI